MIFIRFQLLIICLARENAGGEEYYNPDCPDLDLMDICNQQCAQQLLDCMNACEGQEICISECYRGQMQCTEGKLLSLNFLNNLTLSRRMPMCKRTVL